jgi:HK97 family phage major capsid protein
MTYLQDAFNTGEGNAQLADPFQVIGDALAVRIARGRAGDLANGNGSTQPQGYLTNIGSGGFGSAASVAGASALTLANLFTLYETVDAAYWELPGAGWICSQTTLTYLAQILIGEVPALQFRQGGPVLLGYPVYVDNAVTGTGTGQPIVIAGAPQWGFTVREVDPIEVTRLEERYSDSLQIGILAHTRLGACVTDPNAAACLVHS